MSFNQPDNNSHMIHLGNYEEYFILYMDGELAPEQEKMVDEFLKSHPDLQAEFEILMSTKLPAEEISFNKEDLMADRMRMNMVDENLLLYIDNELTFSEKEKIEAALRQGGDISQQHAMLMKAKLDPKEVIPYPNKEELYHRSTRVVAFKTWMRVAAVVAVIATGAVFYFQQSGGSGGSDVGPVAGTTPKTITRPSVDPSLPAQSGSDDPLLTKTEMTESHQKDQIAVAVQQPSRKAVKHAKPEKGMEIEEKPVEQEMIAFEKPVVDKNAYDPDISAKVTKGVSEIINVEPVTGLLPERNTIIQPITKEEQINSGVIASNNRKGSIKGLLRKATKVIEKRTGIDPTNDDGQLLIGAVAIQLK